MYKIVGITGVMGSGKSFISNELEKLGALLYNTDQRSKYLQEINQELKKILIEKFGEAYYMGEEINSNYVRNLIFDGTKQGYKNLAWITNIVKKYVREDFKLFYKENKKQYPYILVESAILYETGFHKLCNFIINVKSTNPIAAACNRDFIEKEDWKIRMKTQIPEYRKEFDFIISNDYTNNVIIQIQEIHNKIINGSQRRGTNKITKEKS